MKKKILALLAVTAMVVTMFSSVTFAKPSSTHVNIGNEPFSSSDGDITVVASDSTRNFGLISGKVIIDFEGTFVTVTLENAVINYQNGSGENIPGLELGGDAKLVLIGDNSITLNENTQEGGYCINAIGTDTEICGDGSLELKGNNCGAISAGNNLTFSGSPRINANIAYTGSALQGVTAWDEIYFYMSEGGRVAIKVPAGGTAIFVCSATTINLGEKNVITTPVGGHIVEGGYSEWIAIKGSDDAANEVVIENPKPETVKTGDINNNMLYVCVAFAAVAVAVGALVINKKREN